MNFKLHAPAKINLRLEVLGKRPDGYHDLRMLMVKLALGDTLEGALTSGAMQLTSDQPGFPCDETNLLWKTCDLVRRESGQKFGMTLHVTKRIPMAAGLGGGSSDAGTLLVHLNQALGLGWSGERLIALARGLGADVPFFTVPGSQWAEGVGERLTPVQTPSLCLVLVNPRFPVSTPEIFKKWGKSPLTRPQGDDNHRLSFRGWREILPLLRNDLEAVTIDSYPAVGLVKQAFHTRGADGVLMSGSGPTVFGIFENKAKQEAAYQELKVRYPEWWVCCTELLGD